MHIFLIYLLLLLVPQNQEYLLGETIWEFYTKWHKLDSFYSYTGLKPVDTVKGLQVRFILYPDYSPTQTVREVYEDGKVIDIYYTNREPFWEPYRYESNGVLVVESPAGDITLGRVPPPRKKVHNWPYYYKYYKKVNLQYSKGVLHPVTFGIETQTDFSLKKGLLNWKELGFPD